jgi:hypothetical protein
MGTKKPNNPLTAMAAGCIAGGVEASAVWPMEFIKVRAEIGEQNNSAKLFLLLLNAFHFLHCF